MTITTQFNVFVRCRRFGFLVNQNHKSTVHHRLFRSRRSTHTQMDRNQFYFYLIWEPRNIWDNKTKYRHALAYAHIDESCPSHTVTVRRFKGIELRSSSLSKPEKTTKIIMKSNHERRINKKKGNIYDSSLLNCHKTSISDKRCEFCGVDSAGRLIVRKSSNRRQDRCFWTFFLQSGNVYNVKPILSIRRRSRDTSFVL